MQEDLIAAYKRVYSKCWTQHEAYEKMVMEPAPRYYVTAKQASMILSPMMRGDFEYVDLMQPLRREMYYALFNDVIKLSERREFIGKSLTYILQYAVTQPAPRFYISAERGKVIRSHIRNGKYDETGKVRDDKVPSYVTCREKRRKIYKERKQWKLARMSEGEAVKP